MSQGYIVQLPTRIFTQSGTLASGDGYFVYTYETNSTTPKATYSDGQLSSLNTNPVEADVNGFVRMFIAQGETIKCVVKDADGNTLYTYDYQAPMIADPSPASVTAVPTGSILMWGTATPPTNYLLCDGSAVSRATYSTLNTLWSAAGYPFGSGDGSTTFNVPDLRGKFPLGTAASGTGSTLGGSGGSLDHTHTGPSHTHTATVTRTGWGGTQAVGASTQGLMQASDGVALNLTVSQNDQTFTSSASGTGNTGTANPAYLAVNYIVKT